MPFPLTCFARFFACRVRQDSSDSPSLCSDALGVGRRLPSRASGVGRSRELPDVSPPRDSGPVALKDGGAVGIPLHLPDASKPESLDCPVEAPDPRKETEVGPIFGGIEVYPFGRRPPRCGSGADTRHHRSFLLATKIGACTLIPRSGVTTESDCCGGSGLKCHARAYSS